MMRGIFDIFIQISNLVAVGSDPIGTVDSK